MLFLNFFLDVKENDGIKLYFIEINKEELLNLIGFLKIINEVM